MDLTSSDYSGVVYVEGTEMAALKSRADWLARMAKTYPKEKAPFVIGGPIDDPPCPFGFTYQHTGNNTTLYLRTELSQPSAGLLHQLQFAGVAPSELAAIVARAAKTLKR